MIPLLVVDPERDRWPFYESLFAKNFSIVFTSNSAEASESFHKRPPVLILISADLPGSQTGIDLCGEFRNSPIRPNLRILLMGEDFDESLLGPDFARRMGADDMIQIPLQPENLRRKMRNLILDLTRQSKQIREGDRPAPPAPETVPKIPTVEMQAALASQPNFPPSGLPKAAGADPTAQLLEFVRSRQISEEDRSRVGDERIRMVMRWAPRMEVLDYYTILEIHPDSPPSEIKRAYFSLARQFHPDRFSMVDSASLKQALYDLFKRMTEAYHILTDSASRAAYDQQLKSGGGTRLIQTERQSEFSKRGEIPFTNTQAKKFYQLALQAINDGKLKEAKSNLLFARNLEPNHPMITEKLSEIVAKLADAY